LGPGVFCRGFCLFLKIPLNRLRRCGLHKFIMDLPDGIWIDEKTGKTAACRVMAVKAYSRTQAKFWYVEFTIISHADRCDLQLYVCA